MYFSSHSYCCSSHFLSPQLLKGVTIAAGGVLPNIHPELLAKKRGLKGKLEAVIIPPPTKKSKMSAKKAAAAKRMAGKKGLPRSKVEFLFLFLFLKCKCVCVLEMPIPTSYNF